MLTCEHEKESEENPERVMFVLEQCLMMTRDYVKKINTRAELVEASEIDEAHVLLSKMEDFYAFYLNATPQERISAAVEERLEEVVALSVSHMLGMEVPITVH